MIRKTLIIVLLSVISIQLLAIPARRGHISVRQPDGSAITICIEGDEWYRVTRTADGAAVTKGDDGYWYYASYDGSGAKHSSGVRVSSTGAANPAAAAARIIPREQIMARGRKARASAAMGQALARRKAVSPSTKAGAKKEKAIIILAQFSDLKFKYKKSDFQDMLTKEGYSQGGATGSAMDYFNDQFDGTREFDFQVSDVVTLSKSYRYYGQNDDDGYDLNAAKAVVEACKLADDSVDFSEFDSDGDGQVDNVFVFVAGGDEAEGAGDDHIWSHQWNLDYAGERLTLDGKRIMNYAMSTELSVDQNTGSEIFTTIGAFCHEFSHCLGLMDLYDTDYEESGGVSDATWYWLSLMDGGCYNNSGRTPPCYSAVELEMLGLGTCVALETGGYSLKPISSEKRYVKAETDKTGEYFLIESRTPAGWDKYIGGEGLIIYHIDKSSNDAGYSDLYETNMSARERWEYNEVNCNPSHQCCDLVEAMPKAGNISQVFWPCSTHNAFTPDTTPAFVSWSGAASDVSVIDIRKGTDGVSFTGAGPLAFESIEEFQDAAIVLWTATGCSSSIITLTDPSGHKTTYEVKPYESGRFSYTFEGLDEKTAYTVSIATKSGTAKPLSSSFTTKAWYKDGYPFIYFNSSERNSDGSFPVGARLPLRVFNAPDAVQVEWFYSSSTLGSDGSGYFSVRGGGTVQARITYSDGTTEIISKTITAR